MNTSKTHPEQLLFDFDSPPPAPKPRPLTAAQLVAFINAEAKRLAAIATVLPILAD